MRTTVTLDADVFALLRSAMRRQGLTFKEAVNEAIRAGLTATSTRSRRPYRLRTFKMGYRPEVDQDKALALAGTLEDAELARKLRQRRRR